jgi:hypothetical protein
MTGSTGSVFNVLAYWSNGFFGSHFEVDKIILPIGISFFTFQSISYTVEVYRGTLKPVERFTDFAFFVTFFPQLVAGPIVRSTDLIPQLYKEYQLTRAEWGLAIFWILNGFIKKILLADYIAVNISSPNTKNLRQLQNSQGLEKLLLELTQERTLLSEQYGKKIPLFLKIAPDLEPGQIFEIANLLERFEIDALIATNTTISRENVQSEIDHHQSGGLSGKPIKDLSNQIVATFYRLLEGRTPIIGVGGIHTGTDALQKKNFGAKVIQIYSGLIYEGPQLIKDCINALKP